MPMPGAKFFHTTSTFLLWILQAASEFGKNSSRTLTRNKQMDLSIVQNLHDFLFSVSANIWFVFKNVWNVYLFLIIYLLICNTITSLPFSPRPFEVDFGGLPSEDSIIICRPPCNGRLSGLYRVAKFRLRLPATTAAAQCVESELRWQFCLHGTTCPEIYF